MYCQPGVSILVECSYTVLNFIIGYSENEIPKFRTCLEFILFVVYGRSCFWL